jgi:hypothetical protein
VRAVSDGGGRRGAGRHGARSRAQAGAVSTRSMPHRVFSWR